MLLEENDFSVEIERLSAANAEGVRTYKSAGCVKISIQPLSDNDIAIHGGVYSRSYKAYARHGAVIKETDRITIKEENPAKVPGGEYSVKSLQSFSFRSVSHLKFFLERPEKTA